MPRAGLTTHLVATAAADLADADGLAALSLAALADGLGVRVPSLYKHVGGLPDVQRRVAVMGMAGLGDALRDAAHDRTGPVAFRAIAAAYRAYATSHPGRYAAALRSPDPADTDLAGLATEVTELVLAVIGGYGGDRSTAETIHDARAVRAALHGFVALEAAEGFGLPVDVQASFDHLVDLLDRCLRPLPQPR